MNYYLMIFNVQLFFSLNHSLAFRYLTNLKVFDTPCSNIPNHKINFEK